MNEIMRTDLRFTHKLPIVHLLDELNALKEKLKPAFPDTVIYWLSDDAFFGSLASFTLTELVPQKGFRRFLGFKHIELATFTRETLFRGGKSEGARSPGVAVFDRDRP